MLARFARANNTVCTSIPQEVHRMDTHNRPPKLMDRVKDSIRVKR